MSRTEQQYICLSITFSAYDGCLVISTEEEAYTYLGKSEAMHMYPIKATSQPYSVEIDQMSFFMFV